LGSKFVFYVNHMALLYLVKNLQLLGWIVRWLLLFLEYNFLMVYKPGHFHSVADALLRLPNATENSEVFDKTIDASLFVL
jgi:hypothetical protein